MSSAESRMRDIEDLAGTSPRKRGRPRKNAFTSAISRMKPVPVEAPEPDEPEVDLSYRSVYEVKQGVPTKWLSHVFGVSRHHVEKRLANLRPVDTGLSGNPLYAVAEAAAYLVEPKVDLKDFLDSVKDSDLPDDLRLKLWTARRARNKVLEEEGELWRSAVVMEKFSEVLLAIREKLQLIPEQIERMSGITPEQYKLIRGVVDGVQEEMYQAAIGLADADDTRPLVDESEEVVL